MGPRSHERGKGAAQASFQGGRAGFNGAAFSRTRKAEAFNRVQGDEDMLQWGRVLTNAERIADSSRRASRRVASMGPRSHERGKRRRPSRPTSASQGFNGAAFSRTRKVANRGVSERIHTLSFNGAAFSRTRKGIGVIADGAVATALQWGRVLTNAERRAWSTSPSRASTLQWGRVLTNAESSGSSSPMGARPDSFNGAAFSRTRKARSF